MDSMGKVKSKKISSTSTSPEPPVDMEMTSQETVSKQTSSQPAAEAGSVMNASKDVPRAVVTPEVASCSKSIVKNSASTNGGTFGSKRVRKSSLKTKTSVDSSKRNKSGGNVEPNDGHEVITVDSETDEGEATAFGRSTLDAAAPAQQSKSKSIMIAALTESLEVHCQAATQIYTALLRVKIAERSLGSFGTLSSATVTSSHNNFTLSSASSSGEQKQESFSGTPLEEPEVVTIDSDGEQDDAMEGNINSEVDLKPSASGGESMGAAPKPKCSKAASQPRDILYRHLKSHTFEAYRVYKSLQENSTEENDLNALPRHLAMLRILDSRLRETSPFLARKNQKPK